MTDSPEGPFWFVNLLKIKVGMFPLAWKTERADKEGNAAKWPQQDQDTCKGAKQASRDPTGKLGPQTLCTDQDHAASLLWKQEEQCKHFVM